MKEETDFKFEPIWLTVLSLLMIFLLYKSFTAYNPNQSMGLYIAAVFPVVLVSSYIIPLGFKMMIGKPAIALTNEYFISNIGNLSIEWHDISEMHIAANNRGFSALIINLKEPEKYFNTPFKKIKYQLKQLFTANDISLPINLVAGDNQEIFQTINAYRSKQEGKY
jgi:hypothetical protein